MLKKCKRKKSIQSRLIKTFILALIVIIIFAMFAFHYVSQSLIGNMSESEKINAKIEIEKLNRRYRKKSYYYFY